MKVYKVRWTPFAKGMVFCILATSFLMGCLTTTVLASLKPEHECEVPTAPEVQEDAPAAENIFELTPWYYDVPLSHELQDYIFALCEEKNVPSRLVIAMIETESSFRSDVISGTDDYGLMQINACNHEWMSERYGVTDFLDPFQNVLCGISYIAGHLDSCDGDIEMALMSYNMGGYGASLLWEKGVYSTAYSRKIVERMGKYERICSAL